MSRTHLNKLLSMNKSHQLVQIILISTGAIALVIFVIYVMIGIGFIIPLLEALQASRLIDGNTPSVWEASLVFLIVVLYMFVLTIGVIAGGLSGWVVVHLREHGGFSVERVRALFRIEEF